jgi:hypothetical protein
VIPLTLPLAAVAVATALRRRSPEDRFLLCLGLPMLLFFLLIGFTRATHVFWPLPAYLAVSVLMGEAAARGSGRVAGFYRAARAGVVTLSAAALAAGVVHVVHPLPGIPPLRGVYDWDAIAEKAHQLRATLPANSFVLGVGKRYLCAAQLSFRVHDAGEIQAKNILGEDGLQFAYWARPEDLRHRDAVVVADDAWSPDLEGLLRRRFDSVERRGDWTVLPRRGAKQEHYVFYVAKGYSPP